MNKPELYADIIFKGKSKKYKLSDNIIEYIEEIKKDIKNENYSYSINKIKLCYYCLMIRYNGKKPIYSDKIDFKKLDKNELIDEKIKIEKKIGIRNDLISQIWFNIIISWSIGILAGIISGWLTNKDCMFKGAEICLIVCVILGVILCLGVNKGEKNGFKYSLSLDAIKELLEEINS